MKKDAQAVGDRGNSRVTLSFIGKYLKNSGIDFRRDGDAFYADIAQEGDFLIGLKKGKLTIALALFVNEEEEETASMLAGLTMARTMMTKIFLSPGEEGMNIWFVVDAFCKTRYQFEEVFEPAFTQIHKSMDTYLKLRGGFVDMVRKEALANFLMEQTSNAKPS